MNHAMSIFSNSEENPLDELNTEDQDEPFSLAPKDIITLELH